MPIEPKNVNINVVRTEHTTEEDLKVMQRIAETVRFHVNSAYREGYVVKIDGIQREREPLAQGNWDFRVTVLKENSVR